MIGLTQIPPVTNTSAQVKVSFKLVGDQPSFVQIYAAPAGGGVGSAQLVSIVDIKASQTQYDQVITLYAGVYYAIYVCPRTGQKNNPDNMTDGQSWDSYCALQYIVTKKQSDTSEETLYLPVITKLDPFPATVNQGNRIVVGWFSNTNFDKFVVGWTQDGVEMQPQDVNQSGTTGSWTAPTLPGHNYTFHVNGGRSQFWNYRYSAWGPTATQVAALNLTSLRQFLLNSEIKSGGQGLRAVMPAGQTLRQFMQL